ncbi:cell cycle protein, FtsW/RodA/SpoVE family, partial [[Clostridium] asparagiforme DSM 15981]
GAVLIMFYDYEFKHYNIRLILYMTALNILGILVIRSATNLNETMVSKQILGVLIGMAVAVGLSLVDYHRILNLSAVIYIICFLSLVAVLVWGKEVNNAKRWIEVPVIGQLQPSEFVKIGLIIFFSWYFMKYQERINQPSVIGAAALLFALPAYLVFDQPNLSTSLVMVIMVAGIVFASGISYRWIAGTLAVVLPVTGTFIYLLLNGLIPFIREYQAGRILAWFNPEKYGQAYYQQANSIIAIGSGQLNGKGLYNTTIASVKNGNFLSEEQTDFIFAVIGEELGFIGCMAVIILFLLIIYECLIMAARAKDLGGRLICAGMATLIAFQAFANIAVATAIFPNTGLPLPFISFGSSSLISIFIGMGLVLNVGLQRETRH